MFFFNQWFLSVNQYLVVFSGNLCILNLSQVWITDPLEPHLLKWFTLYLKRTQKPLFHSYFSHVYDVALFIFLAKGTEFCYDIIDSNGHPSSMDSVDSGLWPGLSSFYWEDKGSGLGHLLQSHGSSGIY